MIGGLVIGGLVIGGLVIGGLVIGGLVIGDWWIGGLVGSVQKSVLGGLIFKFICVCPAPQGKRMKIRK